MSEMAYIGEVSDLDVGAAECNDVERNIGIGKRYGIGSSMIFILGNISDLQITERLFLIRQRDP